MKPVSQAIGSIIRWLEKHLRIDVHYVLRNGIWLGVAPILSAMMSLVLAYVFANYVPRTTYGNYRFILSIAGVLTITTLSQMDMAIVRAVSRSKEGSFFLALKTKIKWGLVGSLIAGGMAIYYLWIQNFSLGIGLAITAVFISFFDPLTSYSAYLQGKQQFKRVISYRLITQLFASFAMLVVTIFFARLPVMIVTYFGAYILARAFFFRRAIKQFPPNKEVDTQMIHQGKHLTFMGVISTIAGHLDKILLFFYLGPIQVAVYNIAIASPEQLKLFLGIADELAFPKYSQQSFEQIGKTIRRKSVILTLISIVAVGLYVIFAPTIFQLLLKNYMGAVFYSQIFSLSLLNSGGNLYYTALQSQMAIKKLYILNTIIPVTQILLLIVGVITLGLMGVILARVVTRFLWLLTVLLLYRPNQNQPLSDSANVV